MFLGVGADGEPGVAGADDNGNGMIDHFPEQPMNKDRGEFGATGSDDPVITPSDPPFYFLVRGDKASSVPIARGVFVDHGYAIGSGGNVRLESDDADAGKVRKEYFSLLSSTYSGARVRGTTATPQIIRAKDAGPSPSAITLSIGDTGGIDEPVTLKVVVRYRTATGKVQQVEAIGEF